VAFTVENSDFIWALIHRRAVERRDLDTAARVKKEYVELLGVALAASERISLGVWSRDSTGLVDAREPVALRGVVGDAGAVPIAMKDAAYRTPGQFVGDIGPSWFEC